MIIESNNPELQQMLKSLSPREREEFKYRRTGRTTAIALETIATCLRNPNKSFKIKDHHDHRIAHRSLAEVIMFMVEALKLERFEFNRTDLTVCFNPDFKWREIDYTKRANP